MEDKGNVANTEWLKGGNRGAEKSAVDFDETPDDVGRELPGVVLSLEERVHDEGSPDGHNADETTGSEKEAERDLLTNRNLKRKDNPDWKDEKDNIKDNVGHAEKHHRG